MVDACTILTQATADAAAHEPMHLKEHVSAHGLSDCTYTADVIDAVSLFAISPVFLGAHDVTARAYLRQVVESPSCVEHTERELASSGIGEWALACVGTPGALHGGWVQNGYVWYMQLLTNEEGALPFDQRLDAFEQVMRSISVTTAAVH